MQLPVLLPGVSTSTGRSGVTSLCLICMQAVCILKQEKPDWDTAKRVLSDTGFMKSLLEFDKDNIPDAVIKRLKKSVPTIPLPLLPPACQKTAFLMLSCSAAFCSQQLVGACRYTDAPEFVPEAVAKQSRAAQSLCMWARAMDTYHRVSKAVAPKRAKLAAAQTQLAEANAGLQSKQQALQVSVKTAFCRLTACAGLGSAKSQQEALPIGAKRLLTSLLACRLWSTRWPPCSSCWQTPSRSSRS